MGAKQRAQRRGKAANKAAKGSLKGSPISQKKSNSSLYVSDLNPTSRSNALLGWQNFAQSTSPSHHNGFSMREEARNTERHIQGWGNTKLREQGISFVSAGNLNQKNEEQEIEQESAAKIENRSGPSNLRDDIVDLGEIHVDGTPDGSTEPVLTTLTILPEKVVPDIVASLSRNRSVSDTSSSSEAEKIVFRGRQQSSVPPSGPVSRARSVVSPQVIQEPTTTISQPIPMRSVRANAAIVDSSLSDRQTFNLSRNRRRGRPGGRHVSDEEAIMQDYIANMAMDDSEDVEPHETSKPVRKNEHFRFFDGSGEENAKVKMQSCTSAAGGPLEPLLQALDWESEDLEAFDDFSTTDDEVLSVDQVLRQRERPGGRQYLITTGGQNLNDPKWVSHGKLVFESALREIRIFEEIRAIEIEENSFDGADDSDDSESSSTADEDQEALKDLIGHIESEDDENTKIMKHTSRMTDEQIARALAKQEELGLGADELMLFNGDVGEDDDNMDAFGRNDDFISFSLKQHTSNRGRSKRNKKRDSFPSAAAFADAIDEDPYGAFDVMDFDRPSLKPKKKGRKSDFPYDLELDDDDLKDQLVSTWARDREKKAARKRDKEEARMAAAVDASQRSEPAAIKAEIRRFLVQDVDVLKLAPMESNIRASVHRLAKALKLSSRSEGRDGKDRAPVLTKTPHTPSYTIDTIWEIDALMNTRRFFPKHMGLGKASKVPRATTGRMRRGGGGGGGINGASYMNGEVVGASAPELGADNKGRLLLEKMGWSIGMGIGKEGNKGSLEAIKHVVKTTKAGLG